MKDADPRVSITKNGNVGLMWIDNPPVNAINAAVRVGIQEAVVELCEDPQIEAVILACRGQTFIVGADIKEFGIPAKDPTLPVVVSALEACSKPTIAAIKGAAFGGGLELALACDYRIATPLSKLGLPEVLLGIIPGAGGTVRLPYLIGPVAALSMVASGRPVSGEKALTLGLVDVLADENTLIDEAMSFVRSKLSGAKPRRLLRARRDKIENADLSEFEMEATSLTKLSESRAAAMCVQAVRNTMMLSFDQALALEREVFEQLRASDESKAMRHAFMAVRAATKVAGVDREISVRKITHIGIVGSGTMGIGIAMAFANAGFPVVLVDLDEAALEVAWSALQRHYRASVARGSISEEQVTTRISAITLSEDYLTLSACDLIIEAAYEDINVKRDIFIKLDQVAKRGAILATNTSYLDVNEIASVTSRAGDIVGAHFFSPAHVMKLLEIVQADATKPDVLKTLLGLAQTLDKVPVVVKVCRGFVGNRMLAARNAETINLLLEGARPSEVDKAFTDFGWPMGPFQMQDMAGLDISWRNRKALDQTLPIADQLCELGRFGQKSGRGFYIYEEGSRYPKPDPELDTMIIELASNLEIVRRSIGTDEIIERTLYPLINEGQKILAEGIASRSSDIDLVWIYGYGFPKAKGGPMYWAEHQGMAMIIEKLKSWHAQTGRAIFEPYGG